MHDLSPELETLTVEGVDAEVRAAAVRLERRESYLVYAVGYSTIGLIWLEALLLGSFFLTSTLGLITVIGAVLLLFRLRARLKESTP
jgi:hypothetical protein